MPTGELLSLAQEIHALAEPRAVPLILNDRVDLVLALNLGGVHLRSDSLPVSSARRLLGPDRLIGVSTHSVEEVRRGNQEGVDYIIFGPIFDTASKRSYGPHLDSISLPRPVVNRRFQFSPSEALRANGWGRSPSRCSRSRGDRGVVDA